MSTHPSRPAAQDFDFLGTNRFEIKRRLGEGSMGAVYLAYDRERQTDVALKSLRRVDASGIYRFKAEFRSLSDVVHPNLVVLHDLFSESDEWFFTMEYVEGRDFLSHVLGSSRDTAAATPRLGDGDGSGTFDSGELHAPGLEMMFPSPLRDDDELRSVLIQIVHGLIAVHAAGKLHRDLKSDNVLVTREGVAKVLDFGIAIERIPGLHSTIDAGVMGTPAYMSPEQAAGRFVSEATDWYALGVMIYEALTGNVPFDGSYLEVMQQKQRADPPRPSQVVSRVPPDLDELCMQLLHRDPNRRPGGISVLRALEGHRPASTRPTPPSSSPGELNAPFVGRDEEIEEMARLLALTDRGKPVVAFIHGPSGIGKTTLVERFIRRLRIKDSAVVLKGRCYERERVPFKAFDSLIDSLSRYLRRLSAVEAAETMPRGIQALAQLFPVLKRVDVVSLARRRNSLPPDPRQQRQRAFIALKEMLCRIADRMPLVVFIDDLQWGDVDSSQLLAELISGADAPAMLLLLTYRRGEVDQSPCLQALFEHTRQNLDADIRELALSPLTEAQSYDLARQLLGTDLGTAVKSIGLESEGNPHVVAELVRHLKLRRDSDTASQLTRAGLVSFERAVLKRVEDLSAQGRLLLELVSVAGRPVREEILALVSTFDIDLQDALVELRGAKLIRGVGTHDARAIETYHDRVREVVVGALEADQLRTWHRRLATAMEATGTPDLEAITDHLIGAGDRARAQVYAIRAATHAAEALAFDKAAHLFEIAVEYDDDAWGGELLERWAESLVNAGRGRQAAEVYLRAARGSEPQAAAHLRHQAGVQFLLVGERERGLTLLAALLPELGIAVGEPMSQAFARMAEGRAALRNRGFEFVVRDEGGIPAADLAGYDLLWSIAVGLALHSLDQPQPNIPHVLDAALTLGEPRRVARALCLFHIFVDAPLCEMDGQASAGALERSEALEAPLRDAYAQAWAAYARGLDALREGQTKQALLQISNADDTFGMRCAGAYPQRRLCRTLIGYLYGAHGPLSRLGRCVGWVREAEEHGDRMGATRLRLLLTMHHLANDDPSSAALEIGRAAEGWEHGPTDIAAMMEHTGRTQIEVYAGDHEACRASVHRFDEFFASPLSNFTLFRGRALILRAQTGLTAASAAEGAAREATLSGVEADIRDLAGFGLPCFSHHARLLRAGVAHLRGDADTALAMLEAVLSDPLDEADASLTVAVAEYRKGQLLGEEGRALMERAELTMRELGVRNPSHFCRLYAAGF